MNLELSVDDPGPKPTDIGDEQRRRHAALAALRDALDAEERAAIEAAHVTADSATTAMWLGASLADLASVTGKTRQAARKKWPDLGDVHRRRHWLGNHVDDILWGARQLLENADAFDGAVGIDELRDAVAQAERDFDEAAQAVPGAPSVPGGAAGTASPAERWLVLDRIVNELMRTVVSTAATADPQAEFALFGAGGVTGYYDAATTREPSAEPD